MNIAWNAQDYSSSFSFVPQYGAQVTQLIEGPKSQFVVDLGCGTGTLTQKLAQEGYRVLGVDDSEAMLALARANYPELAFRRGNAVDFSLEEPADVIFSNAVFHWIGAEQQDEMLANVFAQLKPGGQLVCEFGGKGCAEWVHSTLERCFTERGLHYPRVFYFPTIGEYAPKLERAGFRVEYATLFDRPTPQKSENGLREWIEMFVKAPFAGVDAQTKESILTEAEQQLRPVLYRDGKWVIDYVRIRLRAVRPEEN